LGCFINIFDEKFMPVIIGQFIGRWYGIVNVKNRERRAVDRRQVQEFGSGNAECGMITHRAEDRFKNSEVGMRKSEKGKAHGARQQAC
jgi:hypothetical protein